MQIQSLDSDAADWQITDIGHGKKVVYFIEYALLVLGVFSVECCVSFCVVSEKQMKQNLTFE